MNLYFYRIDDDIHNCIPEAKKYILTRFNNLPDYYFLMKTYDTSKWLLFGPETECDIVVWPETYEALAFPTGSASHLKETITFHWNFDEIVDEYLTCCDCNEILDEPNLQPMCSICSRVLCDDCTGRCDSCDKYVCGTCSPVKTCELCL